MLQTLLRSALDKSGLSAREVAKRARLHPGTVSRWVLEGRRPRPEDLLAVGRVLKIPRDKLRAVYEGRTP